MMKHLNLKRLILVLLLLGSNIYAQKSNLKYIQKEFQNADSNVILVAAHRGAHIGNVENSIQSTKYAIKLGVDIIELDAKVTKDGIPVLMHDRTINRTTNGKGKVSDYTFEELRRFRLKSWLNQLTDERIPSLESVLKLARGKILIDIDLKTDNVGPIVAVVRKTRTEHQIFYFSKNYNLLSDIKKLDKDALFMPRAYSLKMADSAIVRFKPSIVHIDPSFNTAEVTGLIKKNNARIWINSLGADDCRMRYGGIEKTLGDLTKYGANVIQTNEPKMMLEYLRAKGLHK
jgi:glycerophosphoryl diester phosphodiesterase